ncbi:MAG TPA: efflux RND transporter periplasmic adaptor subunit [Holophaga sp.]|mgnify:CR=1 FL=1|nr:efflux RND transporter periplasmic adaptor subunit [Holophaga sp.]HPS67387.1 efflux RND transporter periplasmic adaptor subunit [Holophaga sp.]
MKTRTRRGWIIGWALAGVLAAGGAWRLWKPADEVSWRSARIERGDVTQRIQATGTLNALIQVSVGTQVSGVVTDLYADFNSLVKKGQVLARIDPTLMENQLVDARAALDGAQGTYANAKADLERYRNLAAAQLVSASDLNAKETAFRTARAGLESARAALGKAGINLKYCTIKAPVDGVVVSRIVDVGQTVAASLSTPNLFTVAQDLSRMKLEAAIDEADIGQVQVGQRATFTVDSYPDETFQAQVSEVQLNPTVSSNVVTYKVVLAVANTARRNRGPAGNGANTTALYIPKGSPVYQGDMALFPGMTANVSLVIDEKKGVLRVPNAALRFNPGTASKIQGGGQEGGAHLWILERGVPRRLEVRTGLSDEYFTEVTGPAIREGLAVLVGTDSAPKTQASTALPVTKSAGPPPPM